MHGFKLRHGVAWLIVLALLQFRVQASMEVFHPIEEDLSGLSEIHSFDRENPAVHAHDTPKQEHGHHSCLHSSSLAHFAAIGTTFHSGEISALNAAESAYAPARSTLSIRDRGPPLL